MAEIGEKIAYYRQLNNMTQADLAMRLYVSSQTIDLWERGKEKPDVDMVARIAEEFGLSIDQLYNANPTGDNPVHEAGTYHDNNQTQTINIYADTVNINSNPNGTTSINPMMSAASDNILATYKLKRNRTRGYIWGGIVAGLILAACIVIGILIRDNHHLGSNIVIYAVGIGGAYTMFATIFCLTTHYTSGSRAFFTILAVFFVRLPGGIFRIPGGIFITIIIKLPLALVAFVIGAGIFLFDISLTLIISFFTFPYAAYKCAKIH